MKNKHTHVCVFCHAVDHSYNIPPDWDIVWQSLVCPACQIRVKNDGGYTVVKMGAYVKENKDADRP